MAGPHHIILIPGFFAFGESLGELRYFAGVSETLVEAFEEMGLDCTVTEVRTLPTASIARRAAAVLDTIAEVAGKDDGPVHLVGHSTGGLDARLAMSPAASLPTDTEFDAFHRVHTLVTIGTPHFGTTLASFLASIAGKPILRLASLGTIRALKHGRLPMQGAVKLGGMLTRFDDRFGLNDTILDQLYDQLLSDFTAERRVALQEFLDDISTNQDLIFQLTPSGMNLFNAATAMHEHTRYGCVLTRARPPQTRDIAAHKHNVYAQVLHGLYGAMWWLAARSNDDDLPELDDDELHAMEEGYGEIPDTRANDGIVPTLSQVFGEIIHCADADHLDVVGHYGAESEDRVMADWLPTQGSFSRAEFRALWFDVAAFIYREAAGREARGEAPAVHA